MSPIFLRALSSVTGRANLKSGSLVLSSIIGKFAKFILYFCLSVHFIISINHITSVPYFADELKGEHLLFIWIKENSNHDVISDWLPVECCHQLQSPDSGQAGCPLLLGPRLPLRRAPGADGALRSRQL